MKWKIIFALAVLSLSSGCDMRVLDESTYVLVRQSNLSSEPGLRAYFVDGDATLNGIDCRELMSLANEAVELHKIKGETATKYECVSLREARERGFK
ncbi:MAG: hypothetical protein CTY19_05305 [Methylomonas sp.]|nr:MAG: hypothetical protein CTY19_05305 [Methylomonas sp.]